MSDSTAEQYLVLEQIVEAISGDESASLAQLVEQAREVEEPASMGGFLAEHVEVHRDDTGALLALTVLCLAHVKLARSVGFKLIPEGRRLCGLLQVENRVERAREVLEALSLRAPNNRRLEKDLASVMRRTGNEDRLVDRYLERADEAMAAGRKRDAITWLREVLLLDSSRRDVARMIRDLQYESRQRRIALRRLVRSLAVIAVLAGITAGIVARELHVQRQYKDIPQAEEGLRSSLELRLEHIDRLVEANPLWLGMFQASRERAELRAEIERLHSREAELAREQADRRAERLVMADSAQVRARRMIENLDLRGAVDQYQLALRVAPSDWAERSRVEGDLAAVLELLQKVGR